MSSVTPPLRNDLEKKIIRAKLGFPTAFPKPPVTPKPQKPTTIHPEECPDSYLLDLLVQCDNKIKTYEQNKTVIMEELMHRHPGLHFNERGSHI